MSSIRTTCQPRMLIFQNLAYTMMSMGTLHRTIWQYSFVGLIFFLFQDFLYALLSACFVGFILVKAPSTHIYALDAFVP